MAAKIQRCARCNRRLRNEATATDWAVSIVTDHETNLSRVDEVWCDRCQSDDEHVEREIRDAATDYVWITTERFQCWPKAASN